MSNLPTVMRAARKERGYSYTEAAFRCRLSIPGYRGIESGVTRQPRDETLRRIATGLGVALSVLREALAGGAA